MPFLRFTGHRVRMHGVCTCEVPVPIPMCQHMITSWEFSRECLYKAPRADSRVQDGHILDNQGRHFAILNFLIEFPPTPTLKFACPLPDVFPLTNTHRKFQNAKWKAKKCCNFLQCFSMSIQLCRPFLLLFGFAYII